jgi:hypothetical protein
LAAAGIAVAGVGLFFTWYGVHRGNHNSSAASLIALNEVWRQGWERYLSAADGSAKQHQFAELLNIIEISCALQVRRVLTGVSRELLTEYLDGVLNLLNDDKDAKNLLIPLIQRPTTFKYIRLYFRSMWINRREITPVNQNLDSLIATVINSTK